MDYCDYMINWVINNFSTSKIIAHKLYLCIVFKKN